MDGSPSLATAWFGPCLNPVACEKIASDLGLGGGLGTPVSSTIYNWLGTEGRLDFSNFLPIASRQQFFVLTLGYQRLAA